MRPFLPIEAEEFEIPDHAQVVVVTGAGISAESGLKTFRDAQGLWEDHPVEDVATPEGFDLDPQLVWRFYSQRREQLRDCVPNKGHKALVDLEQRLKAGDGSFTLITQNVDGLHQAAGSEEVINIHGNLCETKCSNISCAREHTAKLDTRYYFAKVPRCEHCNSYLRPAVVWFGEMLGLDEQRKAINALRRCDWFIAVGTSGMVYPVAGYVEEARAAGAQTILVNLEPSQNAYAFHHFIEGKSSEILPQLVSCKESST